MSEEETRSDFWIFISRHGTETFISICYWNLENDGPDVKRSYLTETNPNFHRIRKPFFLPLENNKVSNRGGREEARSDFHLQKSPVSSGLFTNLPHLEAKVHEEKVKF